LDSKLGNDGNSGRSPRTAWRTLQKVNSTVFNAGDHILFKANGVWEGQLWPKGSGNHDKSIVIDRYGEGQKPLINGQGAPFVVHLYNQSHWIIRNLEITNYDPLNSVSFKRGIYVRAEDYGSVTCLHFTNLSIHDVNGNMASGDASPSKDNGGIFFQVTGDRIPTYFEDILISRCHIYDVDRTGIALKSSWEKRTLEENINWTPSRNVVIRNNMIEKTGGNGLIWRVSLKPLVEHNVFKECAEELSGNAMFFFNCDSAIAQYNEAYLTVYEPGETDGSGFDADYRCKHTIYQYNYSHDNGLGAFVVCTNGRSPTAFQHGAVVRYNISQNESREVFHLSGPLSRTQIYNNVIFLNENKSNVKIIYHKSWGGYPDNTSYHNNIFYILGDDCKYDLGGSTHNVFDFNVFFGIHPNSEPTDPHKIIADPLFVDPGSGYIGIETLEGYKLKNNSPCIDSGINIENNGGKDFWGNPIYSGPPDRGVHEKKNK